MSSTGEKVKFAVVGCGHIGKRHAEMIARNPECELVALCDVRPKEDLGLGAWDVPYFTDAAVMLKAVPEVDVVKSIVPPISSTSRRQIAKPRPVPP